MTSMPASERVPPGVEARLVWLSSEMAWRVDHAQADTVHELFTPDGVLAMGGGVMRGRAELAAWGAKRAEAQRMSRHVSTNHRFVGTGPTSASGTVIVTVFMDDPEQSLQEGSVVLGEYLDEYVLADGEWLFRSRRFESLFKGRLPR